MLLARALFSAWRQQSSINFGDWNSTSDDDTLDIRHDKLLRAFKDVFVLPDIELQFNSFNKFNSEIEFWVKSPSISWSDATARHHVVTPLREHLLRLDGRPEDSTLLCCWALHMRCACS